MGLISDNNPIQVARMRYDAGKGTTLVAPLVQRNSRDVETGKARQQPLESRQRSSGFAPGLRGANTRLENTGKESKLVDISKREITYRRRRAPNVNLMRTPIKQQFSEGERPNFGNLNRGSYGGPRNQKQPQF